MTTTPDQDTDLTASEWMAALSPDFVDAICIVAEDLNRKTYPSSRSWLNDAINDFAKVLETVTSGSIQSQNVAISALAARLIAKLADQRTK